MRIWCVRPVSSWQTGAVCFGNRSITSKWVTACLPPASSGTLPQRPSPRSRTNQVENVCGLTCPGTMARYRRITVCAMNWWPRSRSARTLRAKTTRPLVSLSSRWTMRNRGNWCFFFSDRAAMACWLISSRVGTSSRRWSFHCRSAGWRTVLMPDAFSTTTTSSSRWRMTTSSGRSPRTTGAGLARTSTPSPSLSRRAGSMQSEPPTATRRAVARARTWVQDSPGRRDRRTAARVWPACVAVTVWGAGTDMRNHVGTDLRSVQAISRVELKYRPEVCTHEGLGVEAAFGLFEGHLVHPEAERREPVGQVPLSGLGPDSAEGLEHQLPELGVHLLLVPEVLLQVLHPLEVADRHAAGVAEDVRDDERVGLRQDAVRLRGGRAVGAFGDDAALEPRGVLGGDDPLQGARGQHGARCGEQLLVWHWFGQRKLPQPVPKGHMLEERRDVDPLRVSDRPEPVADGDDLHPALEQLLADDRADVAEPLDHGRRFFRLDLQLGHGLQDAVDDPAAGRLASADAPAQLDRLAGDNLRTRVPDLHRVRVHDPGHGLLVGPHVRGHDVHPRADDRQDFLGVPAGQAFQFPLAHLGRVAGDPALGPGERQVHDADLPGHPHGQGRDLAKVPLRGVAQTPLRCSARDRVLDPVAAERCDLAAVQADRDGDDQRPLRDR